MLKTSASPIALIRQQTTKLMMPMAMHRTFLNTLFPEFCISSSTNGSDSKLKDHNGIQIEPSCRWVTVSGAPIDLFWCLKSTISYRRKKKTSKKNSLSLSRSLLVTMTFISCPFLSLSLTMTMTEIQKLFCKSRRVMKKKIPTTWNIFDFLFLCHFV